MKHRGFVLSCVALGFVLSTSVAQAQTRGGMRQLPRQQDRSARLYVLGGYAQVQLDEMNARLASLPEPYSPVSEDLVLFGGGLHGRIDRWILGVEVATLHSIEEGEMGDERTASLSGMTGTFGFGYSILQSRRFDFYPLVQVGGTGATLLVEERDDPTWDELLGDPGRTSSLSTILFHGAAGAGMDLTFDNGFFIGVRGTWSYTPPRDGWSDERGDVLGGPELDMSGPSVRLMLGFGGSDAGR
ncbi:MAG TPA: hypothetical protein VF039_09360 [Longimicrobiales bacterium]